MPPEIEVIGSRITSSSRRLVMEISINCLRCSPAKRSERFVQLFQSALGRLLVPTTHECEVVMIPESMISGCLTFKLWPLGSNHDVQVVFAHTRFKYYSDTFLDQVNRLCGSQLNYRDSKRHKHK